MDKLFVDFELSMVLKQLKFNTPCFRYYSIAGNLCENNLFTFYQNSMGGKIDSHIAAPLYQQVFDWFRDKYNISIEITYDPICENICDELDDSVNNAIWFINLIILNPYNCITPNYQRTDNKQLTYESARKVAINEALKLI